MKRLRSVNGWVGVQGGGKVRNANDKKGVCRSDEGKKLVVIVLIIYNSAAQENRFSLTRVFGFIF